MYLRNAEEIEKGEERVVVVIIIIVVVVDERRGNLWLWGESKDFLRGRGRENGALYKRRCWGQFESGALVFGRWE